MDRIERLEVKKELSLVRSFIEFIGIKEQRNIVLWMVTATPNTSAKLFVDATSVKSAIVHFYENLYHEDQPSRSFLGRYLIIYI